MKDFQAIKAAIKANFENNPYDVAYAMSENLFTDYVAIKGERSLKSLLAYFAKQAKSEQPAEPTADEQPTEETVEEQVVETEDPGTAVETKDEATKAAGKLTFIYFAVTVEDFDNGNVNIQIAIDGLTATTRRHIQRMLNDAGHTSENRWVIAAAVQDEKIIGYGTNKEEASKARFAA